MAHSLRVEYDAPFYHVMARGNRRGAIFLNNGDRWASYRRGLRLKRKAGGRILIMHPDAFSAPYGAAFGQEAHSDMETIHRPDAIKRQSGPPSLSPGAKFVVLEGDPAKQGFFTMRVLLPDGYRIPPHTHPKVEHITVISGTFNFGTGEKFDESKTNPMPAGTFGYWPAGMKHFVWAKGETIVQLHGIGAWKIDYLNPADDLRKK